MIKLVSVKPLSKAQERELLNTVHSTKDTIVLKRTQIVLLSNQGKKVKEITKIVGAHWHTVIHWIRRYEKDGIKGLGLKPHSGRPPRVKEKHRKHLLEDVHKSPRLFGYKQNNWTLYLLKDHMQRRMDLAISHEHVRRILNKGGISFRRPKLHLTSPDPDYVKKNESWSN